MKRDWTIIRQILLKLEESPTPSTEIRAEQFESLDTQSVAYNMRLLAEAGLIEAIIRDSMSQPGIISTAIARRLTNAGHELLDTIRSDTLWEKIKSTFTEKAMDMSIDLVLSVGKKVAEQTLLS